MDVCSDLCNVVLDNCRSWPSCLLWNDQCAKTCNIPDAGLNGTRILHLPNAAGRRRQQLFKRGEHVLEIGRPCWRAHATDIDLGKEPRSVLEDDHSGDVRGENSSHEGIPNILNPDQVSEAF